MKNASVGRLDGLLLKGEKRANRTNKIADVRTVSAGFTLIELLVVVLIIGILSAVALPQYNKVVEKVRAREAVDALRTLATAEEAYYLATGEHTLVLNDLDISLPCKTRTDSTCSNDDWRISVYSPYWSTKILGATRLKGPYTGVVWQLVIESDIQDAGVQKRWKKGRLTCHEGGTSFAGTARSGEYCMKIFSGTSGDDCCNEGHAYKVENF